MGVSIVICNKLKCWKFVRMNGSVWSILGFAFDKKCVRVMSEREVGYRVVTEKSTGWWSVKNETMGG